MPKIVVDWKHWSWDSKWKTYLSLSLSNMHIHTHTHTTLCEDFLRSNPNHPDYTPQPKPPLKPSPTTPSLCEDRPKMSPLPPKNVLTLLVERASAGTNTHAHTDTHARTHLACVVWEWGSHTVCVGRFRSSGSMRNVEINALSSVKSMGPNRDADGTSQNN